jgi:uncharacterized repeat protein (TIGR01451 family)
MNTKTNIIRQILSSRVIVAATILLTFIAVSTATMAYGPQRPTFTTQQPATYVTFDSITNNASYGDERNFTTIKDASNTAAGGWKDTLAVENGKEYLVRVLVHNNASENLNLVAKNTRLMVNVPNVTANSIQLDGFVTADNANPKQIWDSAVMTSDKKFNITYVAGSATYYNNIFPGGTKLSDSIVTSTGALVGYQKMDGNIQGCYKYSGVATFKVKVATPSPNFTVEKKVRLNGTTAWQKSLVAKPGQKVDYQIGYVNTGTTSQVNVAAIDKLPAGVSFVANSTTVKNITNPNGNGASIAGDEIVQKGLNFGNYGPNANAYIRFTAVLPTNEQLPVCGPNQLVNTATVATQNGDKSDTVTVTVTKTDCVQTLPTTGPVEVISGFIGIAAITIGVVYYFRSRQQLDDVLLDVQSHPLHIGHDIHHDKK